MGIKFNGREIESLKANGFMIIEAMINGRIVWPEESDFHWQPNPDMVWARSQWEALSQGRIGYLRMHYAKTLDCWIANFENRIEAAKTAMLDNLGSPDKVREFILMWRLYLNGSSAAFKYGTNRLYQIVFSNGLKNDLPLTRKYIYPE